MKLNRKLIKKHFEKIASQKELNGLEDELAQAFVKTGISAGCEVAVFIRNPERSYSTRAVAMTPETLTYQMAKTILAMQKKTGMNPEDFLNGVAAAVLTLGNKE